ncbi:hypothetical protein PFISCL1PPCAC_27116, partial [Pristionchus fissidentatus]
FSILLLFLHEGASQYLEHHILNHLTRNISACDDFYRHVCGKHVKNKEFATNKVVDFYERLFEDIGLPSERSSSIQYDSEIAFSNDTPSASYESVVTERCGEDETCYFDELNYYGKLYKLWKEEKEEDDEDNEEKYDTSPTGIQWDLTKESAISSITDMIDEMMEEHEIFSEIYNAPITLHKRIAIVEFVRKNNSYSDFIDVSSIIAAARQAIIARVESTPWLLHSTENGSPELKEEIIEKLQNSTFHYDFNTDDLNLERLRKLLRELTKLYFAEKSRTCGNAAMDFVFRSSRAYLQLIEHLSVEESSFLQRLISTPQQNAVYYFDEDVMFLLAPTIYRNYSRNLFFELEMPALYTILHEFHHSIFRNAKNISQLVKQRLPCLANHYSQLCAEFGKGECHSGDKTLPEDAPDVEGVRTAYDMFSARYSAEEKSQYFDKFGVTRDQAFFYAMGMDSCGAKYFTTHSKKDKHSPPLIRLNGMMSLMPEFSRAFQCQKDDIMYSTQESTCFVFGNNQQN